MAAPKLKSTEVIDRVNALRKTGQVTAWEIAQIKREALSIRDHDPAGYWVIIGALAAIELNEPGVREAHENALRLMPGNSLVLYNFSGALAQIWRFREAFETAVKANETNQSDVAILDRVIVQAMSAGIFDAAQFYLDRRNSIAGIRLSDETEEISEGRDFLRGRGIPDEIIEKYCECAYDIAIANQLRPGGHMWRVEEDEDGRWLSREIIVKASPQDAARLNEEFAEAISNREITDDVLNAVNVIFLVD